MEVLLKNQTTEACNSKAPLATEDEVVSLHAQIPEWDIVEYGGEKQLKRSFTFKNFKQALAFTMKVGEMAETEGHHPVLVTEWGKVDVFWWTHSIGGLHKNDFITAAKTSELYT